MGILNRERESVVEAEAWPLAARIAAGLVSPGGESLIACALDGVALDRGSRVVELDAGLGVTSRRILARVPRSWTGVDDDPLAVEHLRRSFAGAGRQVVHARASQTGLEDCSASIVVINGALSLRDDIDARAVLAEAVRIVRPSGRVAVVDLVPIDEAEDRLEAVADVDVHVRSVARLRRLMTDAGMVMVGSVEGPAACEDAADLARGAGPRMGMKLAREATDARVRRAATVVRQAVDRAAPRLRAAAVVAERPLIMGMCRPR